MKKFFSGLFVVFFAVSSAWAGSYSPIEISGNISGQRQVIDNDSDFDIHPPDGMMIVGGASSQGSAKQNSLTITNHVTINETNTAVPSSSVYNHYIAGGAVQGNTAEQNTVNITEGVTIKGRAVAGGLAQTVQDVDKWGQGSALNNTVNISSSLVEVEPQTAGSVFSIGGSAPVAVAGGASGYFSGNVSGNTVNIDDSTINGAIVGGLSYINVTVPEITERNLDMSSVSRNNNDNAVLIKDSTVNGFVYGSYGGINGNNNLVRLDNSTVDGSVVGAQMGNFTFSSGSSSTEAFDNNRVELLNGSTVKSAAAVLSGNTNASGNTLLVDDSTVENGTLYSVAMFHAMADNTDKLAGATNNNTLNLLNMGTSSVFEVGGALNMVGNPSGNVVNIANSNLTVNFDAAKTFGGEMNVEALKGKYNLLGDTFDVSKGYIFGGATADYTSQTSTLLSEDFNSINPNTPASYESAMQTVPNEYIVGFGSSADNNVVNLEGGTITANVFGGFASYVREIDYSIVKTNDNGQLTSKTCVVKNGDTITTTTTTYTYETDEGTGTVTVKEETKESETFSPSVNDVFSASNNVVSLKDVTLEGNVYAGYVDGVELKPLNMITKDNKVIIAGNTTINGSVYGGSNAEFYKTNKLIFSHVANGNDFISFNANQFINFNPEWDITADFDTRIAFEGTDIHALVSLDKTAMKEDSQTIIKVDGTAAGGYGPVECNGDPECIKAVSDVTLAQDRLGVYSYTLTPGTDGTMIAWTLTGKKDKANVEVYGQLPLVGLALASEGTEFLSKTLADAWKNEEESSTFLNGGYHHTKYETGSGFELDSGLAQAGAWTKFSDNWLGGFFAKYSGGSYETYPIKVSGEASAFGGGLMTAYRYSDLGRLEANVEAGYLDMEFESVELLSTFKSNGLYYGAGFGVAQGLNEDLELLDRKSVV